MITKPVTITRWQGKGVVGGFRYVIVAANGHDIAELQQRGKAGLKTAKLIRDAINMYIGGENGHKRNTRNTIDKKDFVQSRRL